MVKKLGKKDTAVMECAESTGNDHHCFELDNKDEINYWYNRATKQIKKRYDY